MKRIVFATGNEGKMKEFRIILSDLGLPVVSMKEAGIHADIVEDGKSFEENADIKATAVQKLCGDIVLADDSALRLIIWAESRAFTQHVIWGRIPPTGSKMPI